MSTAAPSVPGVWAVGDVIDTAQLAHIGFAEGMLAITDILGEDRSRSLRQGAVVHLLPSRGGLRRLIRGVGREPATTSWSRSIGSPATAGP